MANNDPVVLVHGILGFGPKELGKLNYWGSAFRVPSPLQRHEASVGPLSSAHDRACELAAQIKGSRIDYGEQHAKQEGHERYGYDFTVETGWVPFVPNWSESKPVHLVGHSLGSPTIRCLQHLLEIDYWGWGSNHRWVKSISTISGVSNGSTLTYYFGADEQTGLIKEDSLSTALLLMIEVYMYATHAIRDSIYNFDLDHWGFERRSKESLVAYLRRVSQSKFFKGKDNACYTLTLQGAHADNAVWKTYPDTYYFSYITEQTFPSPLTKWYYPEPFMNPAMLPLATYIGRKVFKHPPIKAPDYPQFYPSSA
jgi:triacylglycerol lipase